MEEYMKPLPHPTIDTKAFWNGCRRHELILQKCQTCGKYRFYPGPTCHFCGSDQSEWTKMSGRGRVYTWTVIRKAADPAWAGDLPYIIVVIELEEQEGLYMPGNLLQCAPEEIMGEMPVEVVFVDITDQITLPQWRPRGIRIQGRSN